MSTGKNVNSGTEKVMAGGLPFLAAGAVWFVFAMILPVYKLIPLLVCAFAAIGVLAALSAVRKAQIAKLPPAPTVKVRAEEMAKKLDICRDRLLELEPQIQGTKVSTLAGSLADCLDRIADEVERDPKDRNKVRKLANHYTDMIVGIVEKYVQLEKQVAAVSNGENVTSAMKQIEDGLTNAETALRKLLDDLFSDDAMEVSADINVLEQLLKTEGEGATMDFSSLNM